MRSFFFFILLSTTSFSTLANAAETTTPFVEVRGESQLKVVPDQFVLHLNVRSFDKNLDKASNENRKRVIEITKAMKAMGVPRKYVVSNELRISMISRGYKEHGDYRFLGYKVSRDLRIVLHNAKRIQPAMRKVFNIGIQSLRLSFYHTDIARLEKNVEIMAVRAAKEKADRMTGALGSRVDKAMSIKEISNASSSRQNFTYRAETPDLGDGFSLDKIVITKQVIVKFAIK